MPGRAQAAQHRGRRQAAFTLVEMIVAVVLLSVGVVAALQCIGMAARTAGMSGEYTTVASLAQQHLSELEAQPSQITGGDQQGDFGNDHPGYTWRQLVETTDVTGVYRVTLTIEWPSGAGTRSAQFVTYEQTLPTAAQAPAAAPTGQ